MRPSHLYPLFSPIENLKSVGNNYAKKLQKLGISRVIDLLWHLPVKLQDRTYMPQVSEAIVGHMATMKLQINAIEKAPNPKSPWRIFASDTTGQMTLSYFRASPAWIEKTFPIGEVRVVSGMLDMYHGQLQMSHPDYVGSVADLSHIARLMPVWPLTAGITNKFMQQLIEQALLRIDMIEEWQNEAWLKQNDFPSFQEALHKLHNPDDMTYMEPSHPFRQRLAYDEILAHQLALRLIRRHMKSKSGIAITSQGQRIQQAQSKLPFKMTNAQYRCIDEILKDMAQPAKMVRLLQGDVGSGKTLVALMAMLQAVEAGYQSCLMTPTEILARQHLSSLQAMTAHMDIEIVILTGREKGKKRQEILDKIQNQEAHIIIGTHALIQDDVIYKKLGLAIIDEQHRFGVQQRVNLLAKGEYVDLLVMTATPIPRSLMLSAWGDMESSKLDEKPAERKPIETRAAPQDKIMNVVEGLKRALSSNQKIYWICPLVEESEKIDLVSVEERFEMLKQILGEDHVHLIHGKMKPKEKDAAMEKFKDGPPSVLVATTVIEVGVDVPDATIIVIEHAERFGLAQLHQLRGRVGRGDQASHCILLYKAPLNPVSKERLNVMRQSNDGFLLAEKDLELRGSGDILGTRQSGMALFQFTDLSSHKDLIYAAADDIELILNKDPQLQSRRGEALRTLLYLFEKDAAIHLLASG